MDSSSVNIYLNQNSTEKYFITYNGFFFNHLSHGIIALYRLGAASNRIERFVDCYTAPLEPKRDDAVTDRAIEDLRGEMVAYYQLVDHYGSLLKNKYRGSVNELIANEYPKMSLGLAGSALHGTIHLGYGYSVGNDRIILEGLAYVFYSYCPIVSTKCGSEFSSFGKGSVDIIEILVKLQKNNEIKELMNSALLEKKWFDMDTSRFQKCVTYLLSLHGDELTDLVLLVKIPNEAKTADGEINTIAFARRIVYWCVSIYTHSKNRNDFFLLHGVTCAWSLLQIIPILNDENGIRALREFLTVLFGAYIAEDTPELTTTLDKITHTSAKWQSLISKALDTDKDEHCYKLVQICFEMGKDANQFGEDENVYLHAAYFALENEFHFA